MHGVYLDVPLSKFGATRSCFVCSLADTTLAELNSSLVREEEGLVACRGLVATYTGGTMGQGRTAAELNDNQVRL